ncbi:G-type lectin S-receptor-like serine/threonine-protein kinase B120 [Zingiber officinale]|uniref:G-type lectin S-receptor-like serine/threonine-protein kinase B120 n=1 Tax=Zingiber officinale TaxID=94328 RepID=UPI001C4AAAB0|nr:G-type lectin S-receptor-like serine/threonine-protein kinase B120 [Zingiber officinale]
MAIGYLSAVVVLTLLVIPDHCHAKDILTAGDSLPDGQTLISAGETFELGFFSPGRSTNRYVGIWYYNFSTRTVLWVANRQDPVRDESGRLGIADDGNLVVLDGNQNVLWSTGLPPLSSNSSSTTTVQLLENGNLMVNDSGGVARWESFENPTDTYLPGMRIGLDLRTNVNQLLRSWKSEDDPAAGNFSMGVDPRRSTQIFIWEGTGPGVPRWRSGRWNGQVFTGIVDMISTYLYGFRLSDFLQEQKMYFYYNANDSLHRYVLKWNGTVEHLIRQDDTGVWSRYWEAPTTECETYNKCGRYGSCSDENTPICSCLRGFVPAVAEEWKRGNWSSGCVRRRALLCESDGSGNQGEDDGFWKIERVKLPDSSDWDNNANDEDGCRTACSRNCSCRAFAYVDGIGCLAWGVDLVDIQIFSSGGNNMYLRLASSELDRTAKVPTFAIALIVLAAILTIGCIFYVLLKYRNKISAVLLRSRPAATATVPFDLGNDDGNRKQQVTRSFHILDESKDKQCEELPVLSFESIITSTSNFSKANLLGVGGFGPVYKGILPGGQEVAVKRLSRNSGQGHDEFKNEIILIAQLQHRNLVRILGCCIQGEEKILVYEYMPNRSLDVILFDPKRKRLLDWNSRYNIIEGVARGLLYLHRDSRLRIIHRDLKASNILLDSEMSPKISDFGMARMFGTDEKETNTQRVVGTFGYMSPEYAMQGVFSVKSDVYSFGVLLLEIICGMKNSSFMHQKSSLNLLGYAWKSWNEDNVMEFVDPTIRDSCSLTQVSKCVNVGLLCVQDRANDRPTMSSVMVMLEGGAAAISQPRRPTFVADIGGDTESSTDKLIGISSNNSITQLIGR